MSQLLDEIHRSYIEDYVRRAVISSITYIARSGATLRGFD